MAELRRIAAPGALALMAVLALALALSGGAAAQQHPAGRSAGPVRASTAGTTRLQVALVEYRVQPSRAVVKAGLVDLEAIDRGRDPHDLRLRLGTSGRELVAPQLTPGRRWSGVVSLRPGTYRLWCSLPQHERLGMRTTLQVVR